MNKLSKALGLSIYTLKSSAGKKDMKLLSLQQIIAIHTTFNIPYNEILNEKIFTPQNIDYQTERYAISESYFNKEELFALKELAQSKLQENSLA